MIDAISGLRPNEIQPFALRLKNQRAIPSVEPSMLCGSRRENEEPHCRIGSPASSLDLEEPNARSFVPPDTAGAGSLPTPGHSGLADVPPPFSNDLDEEVQDVFSQFLNWEPSETLSPHQSMSNSKGNAQRHDRCSTSEDQAAESLKEAERPHGEHPTGSHNNNARTVKAGRGRSKSMPLAAALRPESTHGLPATVSHDASLFDASKYKTVVLQALREAHVNVISDADREKLNQLLLLLPDRVSTPPGRPAQAQGDKYERFPALPDKIRKKDREPKKQLIRIGKIVNGYERHKRAPYAWARDGRLTQKYRYLTRAAGQEWSKEVQKRHTRYAAPSNPTRKEQHALQAFDRAADRRRRRRRIRRRRRRGESMATSAADGTSTRER